jgi:signal transduction histidine kinase
MPEYDLAYAATLVTVTFCALLFWVLAIFLWREKRAPLGSAFAPFTLVCAAAFLANLLLTLAPRWETPLTLALDLAKGLLPACLFHLVARSRAPRVRVTLYGVSAAVAIGLALDDAGWISLPFAEVLPAAMLAGAGALGLALLSAPQRRQRAWYRLLLSLLVATAVAGILLRSPLTELAPDYLFLGIFCVTLYYQERVVFFDLLIQRGIFFVAGLLTFTAFLVLARSPDPLTAALLFLPLWMLAPWLAGRLELAVDRVVFRRRYSHADAQRLFAGELQAAKDEEDLRLRARGALAKIFAARAEVEFSSATGAPARPDAMAADLRQLGWAAVEKPGSGIPLMTVDRRLFDSLAATLAIVLENVRFREQQQRQQEREEQLRLLASRAELKALRAQINPHFLFNALNAIAGLIPSQPELADRTIEWLAHVFRYTLRKSENEWVRLDEEVEFVTAYLRIEQSRFGERLAIAVALDPNAAAVPVPAICIQPLVENALKHGVSPLEGRGEVRLSVQMEGELLRIEVADNGPGFPAGFTLASSSGHALRNIAERLSGYYGETGELRWDSTSGLTRVWLRIPSQPQKAKAREKAV